MAPAQRDIFKRRILFIRQRLPRRHGYRLLRWNTAGDLTRGPRIITPATKAEMKRVLDDIQSGRFTRDWMLENKVNQTSFKATRAKLAQHPIEEVGAKLRDMMPWIKKGALVDKSKN